MELRADSPANKAGLNIGDVVLSINGHSAHQYSLQQINQKFCDTAGKQIKLKVMRGDETLFFTFKLEAVLK